MEMSVEDYALNLLLVAAVLRQIRGKRLTTIALLWPVALVAAIGVKYLHGIPTSGNDLALTVAGGVVGGVLGCLCGAFTRVEPQPDGAPVAKAGGSAAGLWVIGVGARTGFAFYAEHGGGPAIARFSALHHITLAAWAPCLVLMALAEVIGRTVLLAGRGLSAARTVPRSAA
jgi:hypothetical protein